MDVKAVPPKDDIDTEPDEIVVGSVDYNRGNNNLIQP
jgi:hypothetical protein